MNDTERAVLYFTQEMLVTLIRGLAAQPGYNPDAFRKLVDVVESSVAERFPDLTSQFASHAAGVRNGIEQELAIKR